MDRMATIELALKNEKTEQAFYLHEARHAHNALAKELFEMLAKDEEEHARRISGLHDKLVVGGQWPQDVPIEVAGTNVKKVLAGLVRRVGSDIVHEDTDITALKKAIDFESKGADLYTRLSAACTNPMEKTFFAFLAGIEREHHLSLADALAFLENPEDYLLRQGHGGLNGA